LWVRIDALNKTNSVKSFAALWTEVDEQGKIKEMVLLTALYEFGAFWNGLSALHNNKLISKPLAKEFFGYQYSYWKHHLTGLLKQTIEMDLDRPDVLKAFSSGKLDWLEFHDPEIKLYNLQK